jgi:hypothetical protein
MTERNPALQVSGRLITNFYLKEPRKAQPLRKPPILVRTKTFLARIKKILPS